MAPSGRLTALLVTVLVAVAGIGAAAAVGLGRSGLVGGQAQAAVGAGDVSESMTSPTPGAAPSAPAANVDAAGSLVAGDPDGATDAGTPVAVPRAKPTVVLAPRAAGVAGAAAVADLLERYFTAINVGDYDAWLTTVSTDQALRERTGWERDYSTTFDDDIVISDIDLTEPAYVRFQFTSHQDVEFAPPDLPETCVRWDVVYAIVDEGVGLRIGLPREPSAKAPCADGQPVGGG